MKHFEFEGLTPLNIKNELKYTSNTIAFKHICNNGNKKIFALALDFGKIFSPKPYPFSTFIMIIEGKSELVIDGISTYLLIGESVIIPGDISYSLEANQKFKILCVLL